MPRIGIISDVHGNLEALSAVLASITAEEADYIVHLGDLVGYNANPRECLLLLQERKVISILGNHDMAILEPRVAESFNILAYQALDYSLRQLTREDMFYLQAMPGVEVLWDRYLLCHGTPENMGTYISNVFQARRIFNLLRKQYRGIRFCFFGHTHVQTIWISDPRGKVYSPPAPYSSIHLDKDQLYLINPGSVGQPRQRDNRARYLLFDADKDIIHFRAVPYDIERAQQKILQARLPEYLAHRLQEGI